MKKTISVLLVVIMISGAALFALPASADGGGELLNIAHPITALDNPLAIVREISGADAYKEALASSPSQILVNGDGVSDFGELFAACREATAIPVVRVTDEAQADALYASAEENAFYDITAISADASLLGAIRAKAAYIRTGLEVALPNGAMTSKEAEAVRRATRGAPATFCVVGSEFATAHNVRVLQSLAVAVWVDVGDGGTAEILRAVASGCNGIIGADDGAIVDAINGYCDPGTVSRTPLFIAHRGYESHAPENSLAAFEEAMKNGGEIFEIDVHTTKDGRIVVVHDDTIGSTTNYDGPLSVPEMTLEEIKEYRIISHVYSPGRYRVGEVTDLRIPTLEEVLELLARYPGHRVFIELKGNDPSTPAGVARIVKEYGMEDQVDVISFSESLLRQTYEEDNLPGMSTGFLGGFSSDVSEMRAALDEFFRTLPSVQGMNSTMNFNASAKSACSTVANDRGMTVWPWTFHRFSNDAAFFSGTFGITTSDVGWAKEMYLSVSARDIEVGVGKKVDPGVIAETYGGEFVTVAPRGVTMKVVGGDGVSSVNGRIIGEKAGTAAVVFSVRTATAAGSEYSLITAPVTVTVTEGGPGVDPGEPDDDGPEPPPERDHVDILISHLNNYSWYSNDGMIVADMGETENVTSLEGVGTSIPKGYVMYEVEKSDGKFIATKYVTGADVNEWQAPDPVDGFLLFFAPSNRSYKNARGGKLLGWELEPYDFDLYSPFSLDSVFNPDDAVILRAYRPDPAFSDVKSGEYYRDPVTWAVNMGITSGTGGGAFSPDGLCTRAQVVTFLWRAAGSPEPESANGPFTDVKDGEWYSKAVLWAVEKGVTVGTGKTTFSPDEPCTRGQIVTFLWRAEGEEKPKASTLAFKDVKDGDYYATPVLWAVGNGVTLGTSETAFSPSAVCTRAQIVTFLYRDKTN